MKQRPERIFYLVWVFRILGPLLPYFIRFFLFLIQKTQLSNVVLKKEIIKVFLAQKALDLELNLHLVDHHDIEKLYFATLFANLSSPIF